MTLIQPYQINLISLSGYIQSVATGTGVAANYYPSTSNPSGYLPSGNIIGVGVTITQSGQNIVITNPIPSSIQSYFGYTGFSITGVGTTNINLSPNQGVLTSRVNVSTGNYTGIIVIGSTNAFAGAISRFNFQMPSGTGINLQVSGFNGSVINQIGLTEIATVYMEFSYNGVGWFLDQWA